MVGVVVVFAGPPSVTHRCNFTETITNITGCNITFPPPPDLSLVAAETAELTALTASFKETLEKTMFKIGASKVKGEKAHVIDTDGVCIMGAVSDTNTLAGTQLAGFPDGSKIDIPATLGKVEVLLRLACYCYLPYLPITRSSRLPDARRTTVHCYALSSAAVYCLLLSTTVYYLLPPQGPTRQMAT